MAVSENHQELQDEHGQEPDLLHVPARRAQWRQNWDHTGVGQLACDHVVEGWDRENDLEEREDAVPGVDELQEVGQVQVHVLLGGCRANP